MWSLLLIIHLWCVYAYRCFFQGLLYIVSVFLALMLLVACLVFSTLFALCLCLLSGIGRAEMSMHTGISGLLKDFRARVQCVWDWDEGLGGIVALKDLMWRLMQRDNTGFVSIVPMSLLCLSPDGGLFKPHSQKWRLGEGYLCCAVCVVSERESKKNVIFAWSK